jgi:hypothetical protein
MIVRRTGIASVAALAALTVTVGGVHAVAPDWSRRMGFDVWNISDAETQAREADEIGRDLRVHGDRVCRQIDASDHVAHALATGRVTLAVAVEELVQINRTRPAWLPALRCVCPDANDDRELVARYAMGKVWRELADEPSRRAGVIAKLNREYAELTGKTWTPEE